MIKFMDLSNQFSQIEQDLIPALYDAFKCSSFIGGGSVVSFENEFSKYVSAKYCKGVANGTDALEIALEALNLPKGSNILVPCNSFIASAECVIRMGYNLRLVPFDVDTQVITPQIVRDYITSDTSAIIAVHLYGLPCDILEIKKHTDPLNIKIIEDCAQAHGAAIRNHKVGSMGDIAAWSFYPGKNLGAFGDAGAITTNYQELYERVTLISNHGRFTKYDHEIVGRNSRLDSIQAVVLSHKLSLLPEWTSKRQENAAVYDEFFDRHPSISTQKVYVGATHVYHHYVIRLENRDKIKAELLEKHNVETGVHYPTLLQRTKALRDYNWDYLAPFDRSMSNYSETLLSLPVAEHLAEADVVSICKNIHTILEA